MPRYDRPGKGGSGGDDLLTIPESWVETRCHVCMSQYRKAIDRMIALGEGYSEISRIFGGEIDRRSISNHAKKHLKYEEAAIRRIIDDAALKADENAELGISGFTKRRVYLETALHKALQQLVGDQVLLETRDAVSIIDALNKLDRHTEGAQLDEIKIQFQAFIQAIKEIAAQRGDAALGSDIFIRARQIAGAQGQEVQQLPK